MATGRVQYVLTGDATALAASLEDVKKKNEQLENALDRLQKKQKQTADEGAGGFKEYAAGIVGGIGALKMFESALDSLGQKAEAVKHKIELGADASKSYTEAFGKIVLNMPGAQAGELRGIDETIRNLSKSRGLGEGSLVRLSDAFAQIQSAIPMAPMGKKIEALTETAKILEMVPTENATGIGLGVGKIMEQSNWTLNGTQAMNLLRQQQTLGLVKDIGPIAAGIPSLGAAARLGQVPLPAMMGLSALLTQISGDTTGEETTTAIKSMTANIMTRSADISERTGIPLSDLQGNFFQRFAAVRERYQAGQISEQQLGDLFPVISKGGGGKIGAFELLNGAWPTLQNYVGQMMSPAVMQGDMTTTDLGALRRALPTAGSANQRRLTKSTAEAKLANDQQSADIQAGQEALAADLKRDFVGEDQVNAALQVYRMQRMSGWSDEDSRSAARRARLYRAPLATVGLGRVWDAVANVAEGVSATASVAGKDDGAKVLHDIHAELKNQNGNAKTRPLENIHHN